MNTHFNVSDQELAAATDGLNQSSSVIDAIVGDLRDFGDLIHFGYLFYKGKVEGKWSDGNLKGPGNKV